MYWSKPAYSEHHSTKKAIKEIHPRSIIFESQCVRTGW